MLVIIIIFLIAIISLFSMMMFRAWEIETSRIEKPISSRKIVPGIYFRHVEKIVLYLTKHIVQWVVLIVIKYSFIIVTKTKKSLKKNWPKISKFLKKKSKDIKQQNNTFVKRAISESKIKIRRIKEKVRKEHED